MPKIMFVDDELQSLSILRRFFERRGYTVFTAKEGNEGLALCKEEKPDIVVTDLNMSENCITDMDGDEMARNIKSLFPDIPIIMLTARDIRNYPRILETVDLCLTKPTDLKLLADQIEMLLTQ